MLLMAIKFLILCSLAASPRDSSLALFISVFCTHTKTINMFLECCKSEICSDFFHQLKWWMCWAVWELQRGQAAVRESTPLPSPHAGFKQGTCRTFLTNGLIYAAIVSFSSGYSFHIDFFSLTLQYTKASTAHNFFFLHLLIWDLSFKNNWVQHWVIMAPNESCSAGLNVKTSEPLIYVIGSVSWQTAQRKAYLFFKMHYMKSLFLHLWLFICFSFGNMIMDFHYYLFIFTFGICI